MPSEIEWTDETWNPTVGCSRVSPGCDNCYAINVAHRAMQPAHKGLTIQRKGERPDWTGVVRCLPERLETPLKWRKPRRVFVDSMSDLFHPDVPSAFIADVFAVMLATPQHTYQVLTKRVKRMRDQLRCGCSTHQFRSELYHACGRLGLPAPMELPRSIWLGTSIESDKYAWRAHYLRDTPAAVRFLSLEPLLGPLPSLDLTGIDWVIVGGESGPGARPIHPDWVRDIRDRCIVAGIPFFFKQWGAWEPLGPLYRQPPDGPLYEDGDDGWDEMDRAHMDAAVLEVEDGKAVVQLERDGSIADGYQPGDDRTWLLARVGKKVAGRTLDGRTWDEMPTPAAA